jgi:DNA-binding NarL/FixJ family response regulator
MKRVLILSNGSLLAQGVDSLLDREPGVQVVGWETDLDEAICRIREIRPDVVILIDEDTSDCLSPAALRLLREGGGIKIIGLNRQSNTLCIYCGEQRVVEEVADLMEAVGQDE